MANATSFRLAVENVWAASTVIEKITHKISEFHSTVEAEQSVVAQFTGTSSNNVTVGASNTVTVNGTEHKNPISGASLDWDRSIGFAIIVEREGDPNDVDDDPTGSVSISSNGFCGLATDGPWDAGEGACIALFLPAGYPEGDTKALTVNLTGTTGYKVSVIAFGLTT